METLESGAGKRVLVCSTLKKDNQLTVGILSEAAIFAESCEDINVLCSRIEEGAAAVLIAIEVLSENGPRLKALLDRQPAWSDIPFIVLTSSVQAINLVPELHSLLRNVTVLERPIRIVTLVSSLQAALAARRRQYQVRDLLADLERARFEAEAANRAKSAFLANMSHEIRTPLGIILGFSDLIANEIPINEESKLYLQTIRRNGEDLGKLIDELLDLSKIEAGKLDIEIIPSSIAEIVSDTWNSFGDQARKLNVRLTVALDESIPQTIHTDPTRLRQILKNIIGNAIKFTKGGSVTVHVSMASEGSSMLQIAVTDTGRGISPNEQKRLFEAFNQADTSTTRNYGGTGLGLFLSRRLARALGGDIVLEKSALGYGSTFVITINCTGSAAHATEELTPPDRATARQDTRMPIGQELAGLNILVAEDAPDNQILIRRILTRRGAKVIIAENGEEAIEAAISSSFDIILMDVQMPLLDGYGATSELRRRGYKGAIVALSAHAMKEERAKSIAMGCDEHLTKPVDVKKLVGVIVDFANQKAVAQLH